MPARVSLSEVLSALSHALDLTEGAPLGHTMRSCLIGMRLGNEIGLGAEDRSALYYALLLKDAGCSGNASRMAALFGSDDNETKARMKLVDWHQRVRLAAYTARNVARGQSLLARVRQFLLIARTENMTRELITLRCERGASIAQRLGFPSATASAIRSLDEHWSGLGYAEGLAGDDIPLLARIANLAQTLEAFHAAEGVDRAIEVAVERTGRWFDPGLVRIVTKWRKDRAWWDQLRRDDVTALVLAEEPADRVRFVDDEGLDEVARAFADIIDAKSPFTFEHSRRVADYASAMSRVMGFDGDAIRRLYRAGLLHDIGKLGVSNRILDKAGPLDDAEWQAMMRHPANSYSILERVSAFKDFAWTAALHHEKLDGSGYPYGLSAAQLDQAARILAVADIYDALTTDRPYRKGMAHEEALALIDGDADEKLCAESCSALREAVKR
ncbi:MAG TPA: HD domain-containing phosphohydrolase [Gemmatimonadaceae bacterium]|nr:HD domain-containing phosphohydrolase [Gemmatimonadaceae bacterium]